METDKFKFRALIYTEKNRQQKIRDVDADKHWDRKRASNQLWKRINPGYFDLALHIHDHMANGTSKTACHFSLNHNQTVVNSKLNESRMYDNSHNRMLSQEEQFRLMPSRLLPLPEQDLKKTKRSSHDSFRQKSTYINDYTFCPSNLVNSKAPVATINKHQQ